MEAAEHRRMDVGRRSAPSAPSGPWAGTGDSQRNAASPRCTKDPRLVGAVRSRPWPGTGRAYATPDIRRSLDAFFKDTPSKRSYTTQLRRKYEDLAPYARQVAGALGLPERPDAEPYLIRPMFVTRWPTAAAFVTSPFPFVALPQLIQRLEHGR